MDIHRLIKDQEFINNIHDNYFKFVFQNEKNIKDFIEEFFPDIAKHITITSIEPQPTEKYSVELKEKHYLDFAVNCKIKDKDSQIYILFEHKANPDKRIFLQIAKYILSVWEEDIANDRDIRAIIPIVFYHGSRKWNIPTSTMKGFKDFPEDIKRYLLSLEYLIFDTNRITNEEVRKLISKNQVLMLAVEIMKNISRKFDDEKIKQLFLDLAEVIENHRKNFNEYIELFLAMSIIYIQQAGNLSAEDVKELINPKTPEEEKKMKTVIELWIQEGLEKGIQQGLQQGLQQGIKKGREEGLKEGLIREARNMIFTYLESKIGNVPVWFRYKIDSTNDLDRLHQIFREMINAEDLEKFLKENFS